MPIKADVVLGQGVALAHPDLNVYGGIGTFVKLQKHATGTGALG
jgi:hypothetical protein